MVDEHIPQIYAETNADLKARVARNCRGDEDLTADILQDTWARAVNNWRLRGIPAKPAAWLSTVARNLLLNEFRRRRTIRILDVDPDLLLPDSDAADKTESADRATAVRSAIARLPNPESRLLQMFYFERSNTASIAKSLGLSERAVEGRLRRARGKLRKELEQQWSGEKHDRSAGSVFSMEPLSLTVIGRILMNAALIPVLLLVLFFYGVSLAIRRLPARARHLLRLAGGIGLVVLAVATFSTAIRPHYAVALGVFGLLSAAWAVWKLYRPLKA